MKELLDKFDGHRSQRSVIKTLLRYGLRVSEGRIFCGLIEVPDASVARAADVDRRVVRSVVESIMSDPELYSVFSKMNSTALLADVAPRIGCTVLEIIPVDAGRPGVLADITQVLSLSGVSIRQAVVDDFAYDDGPRLIIVLDGRIPPEYIARLKECDGVASIILR